MKPLKERFEDKFLPEPNTGCWLWTASIGTTGYGQFMCRGNKLMKASRMSYLIYKGKIPKGKLIRHTCDERTCVNPDHLILGTHKDNAMDRVIRGRGDYSKALKGEDNGSSILKEWQVLKIINLHNSGMYISKIAKLLNLNRSAVGFVTYGRSWGHLTGIKYVKKERPRLPTGKDHHMFKYSYEIIKGIRDAYEIERLTVSQISIKFAIPKSYLYKVVKYIVRKNS